MTEVASSDSPMQLGKRYRCAQCGTELLCVKGGPGHYRCCGAPMEIIDSKPLPAGD